MRRALLISHHFPPVGGGGVQRSVKLVRLLPEYGYEPVVIAGPGSERNRWTPEDATLTQEIADTVEIYRVPGPEPKPSTGWRRRAERVLDLQGEFATWWIEGVKEVGGHIASSVDAILPTLGPYVTAPAAVDLARIHQKPLIVDLRDPWALDEIWLYPSYFHRRRDLVRMRTTLRAAAAIVMSTPDAARRVVKRFPELGRKFVTSIPNGFDRADFEGSPPARRDRAFRIVHAGGLYAELGLSHRRTSWIRRITGGMPVAGVDLLPRSHVVLLEAVGRLLDDNPELADVIEVHLAGVMSALDRRIAETSPVVRVHGFLPHAETVELLRSADLLFLPMHDLPSGSRAGLVPGKTYEYLAAGRSILAAVPEGDARDILEESGAAVICRPSDVAAMATIISNEIERWRRGRPQREPRKDVVDRYEWHNIVRQMAEVLDRALADAKA